MLAAPEPTSPRTVNGRRLSAASLQREHEYLDWLEARPQPEGDVPPPDDSMAVFMAERRAAKERARLQQVAERRREERWRQRYGHAPVHSSRHDARLPAGLQDVEAYVNERRAKADAAGRRCAPGICLRQDFPQARRKEKERLRLLKVTEKRRQDREAARQGPDVPRDAAGRQTLPLSRSGLRNVPSESSNGVRKLPLGFSVRSRKQLRARSGMPLVRQPVVCGGRSSARVGLAQQSHLLLRRCNGPLPHHRRHTLHPCLWWPHSS